MNKICVVGLGYVGLPLAIEFGKKFPTVGYDVDEDRVTELNNNHDTTEEVSSEDIEKADKLTITAKKDKIQDAKYYIITVPTPLDENKIPDLSITKKASRTIGRVLERGNIVVYESTVYPGATEEEFVPLLEEESGLTYNENFYCGYSPERINPGDNEHTLTNILKVTSGSTPKIAQRIDELYKKIINAGVSGSQN